MLLLLGGWAWGQSGDLPERPNLVFILIDDMGLEMSNPYGSEGMVVGENLYPYRTPRMDAFAEQGMRFEFAFATPSCAPTRAQFLTGRYPFRTGILYPTLSGGPLDSSEVTLARILQHNGYRTGMAGKWNLRFGKSASSATEEDVILQREHLLSHGFDESHTFIGHTIDYGNADPESEYVPYQINQWVLDFLNRHAKEDQPFYLQYSLGLIHTPLDPTPLNPAGGTGEDFFLDMIAYADLLVGKVLDAIDSLGIANSTLVIIAGDNGTRGGVISRFRSQNLSGRKLSLWDLGSRVPFFVRWPGVVEAGSVYEGLTDFSDIFPTLIEIGGGLIPGDRVVDGKSFVRQLAGETDPHRDYVYCQILSHQSIRDRQYKWVIDGYGLESGLYAVNSLPMEETFIPEPYTPGQQAAKDQLEQAYNQLMNTPAPDYTSWVQALRDDNPEMLIDPGSDEDGDGISLAGEYAFGGDPLKDSGIIVPEAGIIIEAEDSFLRLRTIQYRADVVYQAKGSPDFKLWEELMDVELSGGGYFLELKVPLVPEDEAQFLQITGHLNAFPMLARLPDPR